LVSPQCQGRMHIWLNLQEHPISHLKLVISPSFVSMLFHTQGGPVQVLFDQIRSNFVLLQPLLHTHH
jgi:hypothetical protein